LAEADRALVEVKVGPFQAAQLAVAGARGGQHGPGPKPRLGIGGGGGMVFARAARFELAFWEMCWQGQGWPAAS
jgi:hypothetical protein